MVMFENKNDGQKPSLKPKSLNQTFQTKTKSLTLNIYLFFVFWRLFYLYYHFH